ncbi:MAG: GatB/YqeY domain-containing protein [Chloroflexi bacterium]|nr:GatB/YqeY domain-containing protein [Chloroflexota bacterium]
METNLKQKMTDDLKQAMRSGDTVRRSVIRQALAAIQSAEMARRATLAKAALAKQPRLAGKEPELSAAEIAAIAKQSELAESDVIGVIAKEARQRQESIDAFKQANRLDLAANEEAELAILQAYLPKQAGRDEIVAEAKKIIQDVGAKGPGDKGKVMPRVIAALKGKADGREINEVVTELLK